MNNSKTWLAAAVVVTLAGAAQATPVFQGRLADGTASSTCTSHPVEGEEQCFMYYDSNLNITILNDWNIGTAFWSATSQPGSAQYDAEGAGFFYTGLTGWVLPTAENIGVPGNPVGQFSSIWNDVGGTYAGLSAQFAGVMQAGYWSDSAFPGSVDSGYAYNFYTSNGSISSFIYEDSYIGPETVPRYYYTVAVRPGDVAASVPVPTSVPEPQTLALALLALGAALVTRRKRPV